MDKIETVSQKAIVASVLEALEPKFQELTKGLNQTQRNEAKVTQETAAAALAAEALENAPGSRRFLNSLLMSGKEHYRVLIEEKEEALRRGAGMYTARVARALGVIKEDPLYRSDTTNLPKVFKDVFRDAEGSARVEKALSTERMPESMERFQKWQTTGMTKAMTITEPTAGGFWSRELMADDFIPLLRPNCIMGKLRMRPYPMDAPRVIIPRLDAASQGYWVGESKPITVSQGTAGRVTLNEKYAGAFIVLTRQLLRSTNPAADAVVRDDIVKVLKLLVDLADISGTGTEFQPRGVLNYPIQTQSIAGRVDPDTMLIMLEKLWSANIPMLSPGVFFNSKLQRDFMRLRDANGQFIYKQEMTKDGTLEGCNWAMSTQITTGVDANGLTTLGVGDFSEYFYGEFQLGFNIETSNEASYKDGNGNQQNLLQNQETALVGTLGHDTGLRHDPAFVKATDVWTIST